MDRKLIAAAIAASIHLALVALGAMHVDLGRGGAVYAALTGADSARGHFAPDFEPEPRATFEIAERDGSVQSASLEPDVGRASEVRIESTVAASMSEDPASRRVVAASCAGKILGRHPEAVSVVVKLSTYELPTMEEARGGAVPGWNVRYEARFVPVAECR